MLWLSKLLRVTQPATLFYLLLASAAQQASAQGGNGGADLSDVFAYIAVFGLFYLFLKQLLWYADGTINRVRPAPKEEDEFFKRHGYTYDYCFVFKVLNEVERVKVAEKKKFTMREVIQRLQQAALDVKFFYSVQRDEVYIKVRADPDRLRNEAGRIKYRLLLDPLKLMSRARLGRKENGKYIWKPIMIADRFKRSSYNPYDFIYAYYDTAAYADNMYKMYSCAGDKKSIFRGVDRINLLKSIFENKAVAAGNFTAGAGLNLSKLLAKGVVLAAFPVHEFDELNMLQKRWLVLYAWPWQQPVRQVKDYFGERIGFYFLFLQHYTSMLMYCPAWIGFIVFVVQKTTGNLEHPIVPVFTGIMVIWSSFFIEVWKRSQSRKAMEWGTYDIEEEEVDRPLFEGIEVPNPVTGDTYTYFPSEEKTSRSRKAVTVITFLTLAVIALIFSIYVFQFWLSDPQRASKLQLEGIDLASTIGSIMNAVVIVSANMAYKDIAIRLNEYENHRTDTQYEDNLISKIFIFQMINSFSGMTYISFIKNFVIDSNVYRFSSLECSSGDCTSDVSAALSTMFLSTLLTKAIVEIFVRKLLQELAYRKETSGLPPGAIFTPLEEQYVLNHYDQIIGTLTDYAQLTVQYGFTVLFVSAFPLAPTIAMISGYIQIRIDGWKLCQAVRRPQPKVAEDIGSWQDMIEILSMVGVVFNFALLFYTGDYLKNYTSAFRWIMFILVEHTAFLLKYLISIFIDDVPDEVQIQLDRQKFLVSKVIKNAQDEEEEDEDAGNDDGDNDALDKSLDIRRDDEDDWVPIQQQQQQQQSADAPLEGASDSRI